MTSISKEASSNVKISSNEKDSDEPKAALEINGSFTLESEPIPAKSLDAALKEVFLSEKVRDLLISGGGTQSLVHQEMTPEYLRLWNGLISERIPDAHRPSPSDALLLTKVEIKFPGLVVATESLTGVKQMEDLETGLPFYEYCLLSQKQHAGGLPPAVWLFQQVTGNAQRLKGDFYPTSTTS